MSRSQGAANGGWQGQRPAGEPDPRTGGRPAQRPQAPQYAPPAQPNPASPQQGYGEQQSPQAPAYHYPQQPQYAPPQAPAPAAAPVNRQGLSSLDSTRNVPPTQDYPRTQPPAYAQQARQAPPQRPLQQRAPADQDPIHAAGGYRQMPPQAAPQYAQRPAQQRAPDANYGAAPSYDQWQAPATQPSHDPYGHDLGAYLPADAPFPANSNHPHMDPLQQADWAMPAASYGDPSLDQQNYARGQVGYDQQHAGALEPTYNQDEAGAYEAEEPRRGSWTMRIAGAVVVAIGLGYGLAQAYKAVLGAPPPDGATPVVSSDATPAKEKPLDPGGKQFSHTDSKVLGRLGDGGAASTEEHSGGLSESDTNNGTRKVSTLVVGRDGSIAPPDAASEPAAAPAQESSVSVPGLTVVDAFGGAAQAPPQRAAPAQPARQEAEADPVVVNPPAKPRVNVKSTKVIPASTASLPEEEQAAPVAPKKQKVATAAPTTTNDGATSSAGANGYVVVLASVPASGSSRLDALKKFADMQQQYGTVLSNKTPDVRETTLAGKGAYHRLLVGPPGSRSQASELCTQLKASGYKDCWVTAY